MRALPAAKIMMATRLKVFRFHFEFPPGVTRFTREVARVQNFGGETREWLVDFGRTVQLVPRTPSLYARQRGGRRLQTDRKR